MGLDFVIVALMAAALGAFLRTRQQRRRLALLASFLRPYQIEQLMEQLMNGYLHAVGEPLSQRQEPLWERLAELERRLSDQFSRFAADIQRADADSMRVSRLRWLAPHVGQWLPLAGFDMRALLQVHARGIAACVGHPAQEPAAARKQRAYTMSAELLLMQHSCHWYCRSHAMASARLMARHHTPLSQVLASVSPATRRAYAGLTGAR